MIALCSCECEHAYFERHPRHVLLSEHSTNLFRNFYCTNDTHQEIKEHNDSKSNLSIQFQLLQPNTHGYEQLLQSVFSTIHESALAKPAMLDFCLQLYVNHNTLAAIRNFAEKYRAEDSIYWYTKESFVYRCVNQTLRCGDIDKCYSLRFYIADLTAQLHASKYQQKKVMEKTGMTILYRGTRHSDEELNILGSLIGCVVAIKPFMSTSRNKKIALLYASPADWQTENSRLLLLEIYADLSSPAIIAADITDVSNFDEEAEILFDIGSKFRVDMLTFDSSTDTYLCRLTATNEKLTCIQEFQTMPFNKSLCQLISYGRGIVNPNAMIQREPSDTNNTSLKSLSNNEKNLSWLAYKPIDWAYIRHIDCIIQWQQTDIHKLTETRERALEIYAQVDVKDPSDDLQIASSMNNVGYVNLICGNYAQLVDLFKGSLNIRERYLPPDHILLAQSYRNLGLMYASLRDYRTAFEFQERALNINQHACIAAQWSTVTTLRNMGELCHRTGNGTGATEYYSKAIETFYKCLNFFNSTKSEQPAGV